MRLARSTARSHAFALALALALALASLLATPAHAQRTLRSVWDDVRGAGSDVLFIYSSPVRGDARDWMTVGAVAAVSAVAFAFDERLDRWVVRDSTSFVRDAVEPFREDYEREWIGDLGTGRILNPINGALYLVGFATNNQALRDAGMGCFATQQASSILRHVVVYRVLPRTRPSDANGDSRDWRVNGEFWKDTPWEEHSFFGGHVANAAGCAAYFSRRFELGLVEPVLFGLAGTIGVARLVDRRHWLSDQVIGAAVGYAMGKAVADRQLRRRARARGDVGATEPRFDVVPSVERGAGETRVGWTVRF